MTRHRLFFKGLALLAASLFGLMAASSVSGQGGDQGTAAAEIERAQAYFQAGFYGHAPRGRPVEAADSYRKAVEAYRAALAAEPGSLAAQRGLARVYFVQRDFAGAARHYQRVTELAPLDLDAYVHQALALIESGRPDAAVLALESAQAHTDDVRARATLEGYIGRIRARLGEEVK